MNHFLNKNNSTFYLEAFHHAQNCSDEFLDIDEGILSFLERMNSNENIKTLYSKHSSQGMGWGMWSSITFCFTSAVERKVDEFLNSETFSEFLEYGFSFEKNKPREQEEPNVPKSDCLKYLKDPNYWNVWNYRIDLKEGNGSINEVFWETITSVLEKI